MGITIEPWARWVEVKELQTVLGYHRLLPNDELHPNGVGNLTIVRDGKYIGYVDIPYACIYFWGDDPDKEYEYCIDQIERV